MRIVAISDSHLRHLRFDIVIPDGDLLIHAGDGTFVGDEDEVRLWMEWFSSFSHRFKVAIAGNHDRGFEETSELTRSLVPYNIIYLQDSEVTIDGIRIYGSPFQPEYCRWAFNLPRNGHQLKEKWDMIPSGLDLLVTHGPPFGFGDLSVEGERLGDELLFNAIALKKPKISVHGHIHYGRGVYYIRDPITGDPQTTVVNASLCNEDYIPINKPIVIDYEPGGQPTIVSI